jgi:hypothetical protein
MAKRPRRNHSSTFKAKVALAVISAREILSRKINPDFRGKAFYELINFSIFRLSLAAFLTRAILFP